MTNIEQKHLEAIERCYEESPVSGYTEVNAIEAAKACAAITEIARLEGMIEVYKEFEADEFAALQLVRYEEELAKLKGEK